jgi:hypothetical protein
LKRPISRSLFALSLIGLLLANASCGEVPQAGWESLKELRHRLLESEADRWLPEGSKEFEGRYLLVREKFIAFEAQWSWLRSGKGLQQLADEITQLRLEGEEQIRRALELRQEKMESLRMEMAALEDLLDPNRRRTLIPELRLQMTTASLQLARLQIHLADGDPWSAEEALRELRQSSQEFSNYFDRLEQRFSDPSQVEKWDQLCEKAVALSGKERRGVLVVDKYHRKVLLLKNRKLYRSFDADLGWNGLDDKLRQGDGATPEGEYLVRKLKGAKETKYHRALLLNYPNPSDRRDFENLVRSGQVPKNARIGSLIEIHGEGGRGEDWTDGCVALDNTEMEILFGQAYAGMPVFVVGKCRIIQ